MKPTREDLKWAGNYLEKYGTLYVKNIEHTDKIKPSLDIRIQPTPRLDKLEKFVRITGVLRRINGPTAGRCGGPRYRLRISSIPDVLATLALLEPYFSKDAKVFVANALEKYYAALAEREKVIASRYKTHCPRGHEYTEENTLRNKQGHRSCRICLRGRPKLPRDTPLEGRMTCLVRSSN